MLGYVNRNRVVVGGGGAIKQTPLLGYVNRNRGVDKTYSIAWIRK